MRQKLITLDLSSYELSQQMPNFSAWVRKHLDYHRDGVNIQDCLTEIERLHSMLDRIRTNKIQWDGRSWMPVPPMHQNTEESE